MTGTDDRLASLLKDDGAPLRDPAFRIELMARLERRHFRRQFQLLAAIAIAGGVGLWQAAPLVTPWLAGASDTMTALAAAAALVWSSLVLVNKGVRA